MACFDQSMSIVPLLVSLGDVNFFDSAFPIPCLFYNLASIACKVFR